MDADCRGDGVERESFLRSVGERDLDFCAAELRRVLTGEGEFASSSEPSEQFDLSGLVPGSLEADLDLETSCSLDELACSLCSSSLLGASVWACNLSVALPTWGLASAAVGTGFHTPAWNKLNDEACRHIRPFQDNSIPTYRGLSVNYYKFNSIKF